MVSAFLDVIIQRSCGELIAVAAVHDFPREACGLLIGDVCGTSARIVAVAPTRNVSESPRQFAIGSKEHAEIATRLATKQMILGVFHSHHESPEPSIFDIENMKMHGLLSIIAGHSASGSTRDVKLAAYQAGRAGMINRVGIVWV